MNDIYTDPLIITVPGPAQAWQRAGRSRSGRHYTQDATRKAERGIAWCAVQQVGQRSLQGYLEVSALIEFEPPASWAKAKREAALAGKIRPAVKPDIDNLAKCILDALNGVLWRDDAQVVDLWMSKRYGPLARTVIKVRQA